MAPVRPGESVGPYRILEEISRGGSAIVYRARHGGSGAIVALKLLLSSLDLEQRARFEREARVLRSLSHPNLAALLDSGEAHGLPFIAFELVTGGSLADLLAKRGRLPWREAAAHGARIASALAAVHDAGLIHRDVKPANVLLDERGEARLADLGIVRFAVKSATGSVQSITQAGALLGTPEYLSPEQANGSADVDGRADLYSLGATLHALVAGSPPFQGESFALVRHHLLTPPPRLGKLAPDVSPALEALVLRLLAKAPADRPDRALDVAGELDAIATGKLGAGSSKTLPVVLGVFFALALGAAGVLVAIGLSNARARRDADRASSERGGSSASPTPGADARKRAEATVAEAAEALRLARRDPRSALGRLDAALERALPLASAEREVRLARAKVSFLLMDPEAARADAERALALDGTSIEAMSLHAQALLLAKRPAQREVDEILGRDPRCARALVVRACLLAPVAPDAAVEAAARAVALDPGLAFAWEIVGSLAAARGDRTKAREAFARALELEPADVPVLARRGALKVDMGDLDGGLADATRTTELAPGCFDVWMNLAYARVLHHDGQGALDALAAAEKISPGRPEARRVRCQAFEQLLRFQEAADEADKLVAQSDDPRSRTFRAHARLSLGDHAGALADATAVVQGDAELAQGWTLLGAARLESHDASAQAAYQRAHELDASDVTARIGLARCELVAGRLAEAASYVESVLRDAPEEPRALAVRARLRVASHDGVHAREDAVAAIKADERSLDAWSACALVAEEMEPATTRSRRRTGRSRSARTRRRASCGRSSAGPRGREGRARGRDPGPSRGRPTSCASSRFARSRGARSGTWKVRERTGSGSSRSPTRPRRRDARACVICQRERAWDMLRSLVD